MSKRTILSGNAVKFMESTSLKMKDKFGALNQLFIPTIMTIFGNNNKLQRDRMLHCYLDIIKHSKLPRMISKFTAFIVNKKTRNNFDRMCILECLNTLIKMNDTETIKTHQQEMEQLFKSSIESPHMESRILTRSLYQSYKTCLPQEWELFDNALAPQVQKSLNMPIPKKSSSMQLKRKSTSTSLSQKKDTSTSLPQKNISTSHSQKTTMKQSSGEKTITRPLIKKPVVKSRLLLGKPIKPTVVKKEMTKQVKKPVSGTIPSVKQVAGEKQENKETKENKPVSVADPNTAKNKQEKISVLPQDSVDQVAMVPSFSTPTKNEEPRTATPESRPSQHKVLPQPSKPNPSTSLPTILVTNNRLSREVPVHPPARIGIKRSRSSTGSTGSNSSTDRPSKIPLLKSNENTPPKRAKHTETKSLLDIYKGIGNPRSKPSLNSFKKPPL
jgi:hypothetical protein